jgi:hypothetical protein
MQDVDNFKDNVRKKVAKLDENLVSTTDMFSLRFSRASIETSLKNLANGKAVGDDGIPNEFLKNGGEAMLNSLVDLFTVVPYFYFSQWYIFYEHSAFLQTFSFDG